MQRKVYAPGIAALLAALLAGCTGGSGDGATTDDSHPGRPGEATEAAQPGKYRTLPQPCLAVGHKTLDELLPGIPEMTDEEQRAKAYAGEATLAYDTGRKVGCRWKVESADATDHLFVDFERVVSYDNRVSDDSQAELLFARQVEAADLPEPTASGTPSGTASETASGTPSATASAGAPSPGASGAAGGAPSGPAGATTGPSDGATPADLQPRLLDGLGDEAFLDDRLSSSGSTAKRRTVTVAFRTSNVMVTVEYAEQSAMAQIIPDSKEMQDRAQKIAAELARSLSR
ncbi:DUF3558 domain-containing protein [Streptomyces sp. AD55]|uniref:DUF3558 domain-containing protein n=1 Tax=Streptomyces sp. AD55 TaxID=3242895 RepID=UPI00352846DE